MSDTIIALIVGVVLQIITVLLALGWRSGRLIAKIDERDRTYTAELEALQVALERIVSRVERVAEGLERLIHHDGPIGELRGRIIVLEQRAGLSRDHPQ